MPPKYRLKLRGRRKQEARIRRHQTRALSTADPIYTAEEVEWLRAVEAYKKTHGCRFPAATDYLAIAHNLGYAKARK